MKTLIPASVPSSAAIQLRSMMGTWAVAAFMPLPILVATDPARSADISCLYLGLMSGWLVTELHRSWGPPESVSAWRMRMLTICTAVSVNVALFIGFGLAAGVQTNFPFPLMAVLSVIPAIGLMPWMLRRVTQHSQTVEKRGLAPAQVDFPPESGGPAGARPPFSTHSYAAILFSGFLFGSCKIAGCIVARIVYGPDYIAQGYVAGDWRTAKLMISLMWLFSTSLSLGLLLADYQYCKRNDLRATR